MNKKDWERLKRLADAELEQQGIQPTGKRIAAIFAAMDPADRNKILKQIGAIKPHEQTNQEAH